MPHTVVCTSCGARLRGPDNAAGRTFECPKCGKPLMAMTRTPVGVSDDLFARLQEHFNARQMVESTSTIA